MENQENQENQEVRTLTKNRIIQFVLRIDLEPNTKLDFEQFAKSIKPLYKNQRIELHTNYAINDTLNEFKKEQFNKFIFEGENGLTLKVEVFDKSICLFSNHYLSNNTYIDPIKQIINILNEIYPNANAVRIGMRYVNEFPCEKVTGISKIFKAETASIVKSMLSKENITRAITIEHINKQGVYTNVQFGVPNKFYPAVVSNYDLMLDIDCFSQGLQSIAKWEETIETLNHTAYDTFIGYMNNIYIKQME